MVLGKPFPDLGLVSSDSWDVLCLVYESEAEMQNTLAAFVQEAAQQKCKCIYLSDESSAKRSVSFLADAAIASAPQHYEYIVVTEHEDVFRILAKEVLRAAEQQYEGVFFAFEMSQVLSGHMISAWLRDYERLVANVSSILQPKMLFLYEYSKFAPQVLRQVIVSHPVFVFGTKLVDNPYYISPSDDTVRSEVHRMLGFLRSDPDKRAVSIHPELRSDIVLNWISEQVVLLDPELRVAWANQAALSAVGAKHTDLIGKACSDYWRLRDGRCDRCPVLKTLQTGESTSWQVETERGRAFIIRNHPVLGANGTVTGVVQIAIDITELRDVQERLAHEKQNLEVTLNSIGDAVIAVDPDGKITLMNPVAESLTGWRIAEVRGRPLEQVFNIINEQDGSPAEDPVRRALREGRIAGLANHTQLITREGSRICIADSAAPIRDTSGQIQGAILVFRDVTLERDYQIRLEQSERQLKTALRNAREGSWVMDLERKTVEFSSDWHDILGYKTPVLDGSMDEWMQQVHPDDRVQVREHLKQYIDGSIEEYQAAFRIKTRAGEWRWVRDRGKFADGQRSLLVGTVRDIHEVHLLELELRESLERFRLLAENAQDLIYRYRVYPERGFEYVSPSAEKITGYTPEDHYKNPNLGFEIVHPEDRHLLENMLSDPSAIETPVEIRWLSKQGKVIWVEQRNTPVIEDGKVVAIEGIARDITEAKMLMDKLRRASIYDTLTGVYNRAYFEDALKKAEEGDSFPISLVSIDVDGLKLVNDTLGHSKGDELLRAFAKALRATVREADIIARTGGDEFVLILTKTDYSTAELVAKRLETRLEQCRRQQPGLPLGVSIGIDTALCKGTSLAETLKRADQNMYQNKLQRASTSAHGIVRSLMAALSAKDFESERHIERVMTLAGKMGEAMRLSQREMTNLSLLAEVHDLGKLGVPDSILFKPGPLTYEEHEQMRQHVLIGSRIARSSVELGTVADLILHHHEWWNGKGYPRGLAGREIPIECRIIAVADAYDAMTNDRPYRKKMSSQRAICEIKRFSGTQFDPQVVDVFLDVMDTGGIA